MIMWRIENDHCSYFGVNILRNKIEISQLDRPQTTTIPFQKQPALLTIIQHIRHTHTHTHTNFLKYHGECQQFCLAHFRYKNAN